MENPSADLVMRWRDGDQGAAGEIFGRYAQRLLALARSRLSVRLARHIDPEDVVQSACRSFFVGARDGRYVLKRSGDLWRLLVAITVHKLQHQVERRSAGKRALAREVPLDEQRDPLGLHAETLARAPTPAAAVTPPTACPGCTASASSSASITPSASPPTTSSKKPAIPW